MSIYKLILSQPLPPSSRPPVTGYKISHDTTGSVMVEQTNDTNFTVEGVTPGVYSFAVLAVNSCRKGKENIGSITGCVS